MAKFKQNVERRTQEIGHEVFELADAAQPRIWQKSWWLDRGTRLLDRDERLRDRAFAFVDCLPSLRNHAEIARHVAEYFDRSSVTLPRIAHALIGPGCCWSARAEITGRAALFGASQMAGRFIVGHDIPSAIRGIQRLRSSGKGFTFDVLGESTTSFAQAERYADVYHALIDRLTPIADSWAPSAMLDHDAHGPMPRVNVSVKLTGLDPHFDAIDPDGSIERVSRLLRPLLRHARRAGAFVNIDMESCKHRAITLELFKRLLAEDEFRDWTNVGIVLQAYLLSGENDLASLLDWAKSRGARFAIRLVKGAYWDAETAAAVRNHKEPPVWTRKWESDACYERMTHTLLQHIDLVRPAFASHNVRSLSIVLATAEELGATTREYEVQMLSGMGDPLKDAMVALGQCVRVYCPYGDLMPGMGYLIRRLLENTSNEGFLKQTFDDRAGRGRLLVDPAEHRPPSGPLPARHYQNTDPEEPMSEFANASITDFTAPENREKMQGALAYVRGDAGRTYPVMIGGQPVISEESFDSRNPARPEEVVGRVGRGTVEDANRAISAARSAFADWRAMPVDARAKLLRCVADGLEARRFELAATIVLEVGKVWREADADVTEAIDHWRYYADQIVRIESRPRLRNIPGEDNMLAYRPKGVCAVIAPWAFPLAILSGMTSAALAAGNTVVMKPASQASVVAAKLVEIILAAGLPPAVINFVPGPGEVIGKALVEHSDVRVVAFTGSQAVGVKVLRAGATDDPQQASIKKMIVEMGGKNAIIVDDDADLDGAVQAVIESAFGHAGQKCSSCSRLIVLEGVYDQMMSRLREAVQSLTVGSPDDPSTTVGPVIDEQARRRVAEYIEIGRTEGRVLVEAKLPASCDSGYYVPPTVFVDVESQARVAQEEIFGPLLAVIRAPNFDQALQIANDTRYALTGGVFSRSPVNLQRARREFDVGNLYINRRITGSQVDVQPFGGFKLSGTGVKAGSPDYLLHFMDARCITENTARSGFVPDEQHTEAS